VTYEPAKSICSQIESVVVSLEIGIASKISLINNTKYRPVQSHFFFVVKTVKVYVAGKPTSNIG
jgi:hypothetical protein